MDYRITDSTYILPVIRCKVSSVAWSNDIHIHVDYIYISDLWYYQFQPFVVLSGNCIYIGFSKHPIYIFINFVSLLVLVVLLLSVLRVLCLQVRYLSKPYRRVRYNDPAVDNLLEIVSNELQVAVIPILVILLITTPTFALLQEEDQNHKP